VPVTGDAAEVRRRLQGTLLTCSVYKRSPPDHGIDPIAVLFTADSLGDPKGVLRTDKNTVVAVDHAIHALGLTQATKILVAVPLFHAYGWDLGFLPTLKLGSTMFLEEEISARRIGKLVREHEVDVLPGTPSMYAELSKLPTAKKLEVKAPRLLAASSRLDQAVADDFFDKYGVRLLSCYHSTEAATVTLEDSGKYPTTVGKPIEGVEVKITSPDGSPIKPGGKSSDGLIWVKSKTLSPKSIGPFDDEKAPASARASAWSRSARSTRRAGCAPVTSAGSTRTAGSSSPGARRRRQGRRQARRARRGRGLSRGVPEDQGGPGDGRDRSDGGRDGGRARRDEAEVRRRGDHRSLRPQPRTVQGAAPHRVLRSD